MTISAPVTIRLLFGAVLVLATWLIATGRLPTRLAQMSVTRWLWLFAASRLVTWFGAYIALGDLTRYSDLVIYYFPEARLVAHGQIPYRDFPSSYGFLFPYLAGALLPIWETRAAVALMIIFCEIAAVVLFARSLAHREAAADESLRRTLALYLVNPASWYWSGMLGYNSAVVLLFWVLAFVTLTARRYGTSLLALVGSVVAGKVLGALAIPVWLADPRRRVSALAGTAAMGAIVLAASASVGIDMLIPLRREGGQSTPANLWYLASAWVPFSNEQLIWRVGPPGLFLAGAVLFAVVLVMRWTRPPSAAQLCAAISGIGWLFMIVSKKSYPHYVPMFLLFTHFALSAPSRQQRASAAVLAPMVLAIMGAIGLVEPGVWNALGQPPLLTPTFDGATASSWLVLITADVALIGGGLYVGTLCFQRAIAESGG